jgi:hypothetical protein
VFNWTGKTALVVNSVNQNPVVGIVASVNGWIVDLTTGSTYFAPVYQTYLVLNYTVGITASYHFSHHGQKVTLTQTALLTAGHIYEFYTYVQANVYVNAGLGDSGSGTFNMGTGGLGGYLASLTYA